MARAYPRRSPRILVRRNTIEWRMLTFLDEVGEAVLHTWLPKGYPESALWRALLGLDKKRSWSKEERERLRRMASDTLYRLKAKGLVVCIGPKKFARWVLTPKGRRMQKKFLPDVDALPEDGRLRIFIYDIPEKYKASREWVRRELTIAGFVMLHKSVWVGKRPLPERFFSDLSERGLFEYVQFFEIKEAGSLMNLDWKRIV